MTIFKKIILKEIPSDIIYEDDLIIIIKDINPKAKTHLLIIPKKEIPSINEIEIEDKEIISHMFLKAKEIAHILNIQDGYQLHINVGEKGGQEIMHLHMHLLSNI